MNWQEKFDKAVNYEGFLQAHGTQDHRQRWSAFYEQVSLTDEQRTLLGGFVRRMNVLCLAGAWCGDCVRQGPILQRIAEASDTIDLRFIDRDEDQQVSDELTVNGGNRVPVVVFLSEDFHECARYGDRTLSRYRQMTAALTGAACPTGIGPEDPNMVKSVTAEWLTEFERIQLMLRLSGRLRQIHGD